LRCRLQLDGPTRNPNHSSLRLSVSPINFTRVPQWHPLKLHTSPVESSVVEVHREPAPHSNFIHIASPVMGLSRLLNILIHVASFCPMWSRTIDRYSGLLTDTDPARSCLRISCQFCRSVLPSSQGEACQKGLLLPVLCRLLRLQLPCLLLFELSCCSFGIRRRSLLFNCKDIIRLEGWQEETSENSETFSGKHYDF
jgi:hypothetical protein